MKKTLLTLAFLAFAIPAAAQTTTFTVQFNKPFDVGFDDTDDPATLDGFNVYVDGVKKMVLPATVLNNTTHTAQFTYAAGLPKGTHTLYVEAFINMCDVNPAGPCAAASLPITVNALPGKPTAPTNLRVVKPAGGEN